MKKNRVLPVNLIVLVILVLSTISLFNLIKPSPLMAKDFDVVLYQGREHLGNDPVSLNDLRGQPVVLNFWASWCLPCRAEHSTLMKLKSNKLIKIIGINYKDNLKNAKKFINEYGNPYSEILIDEDGTIAISLGAYGIPETIVVDRNQIILKKFFGAINNKSLKEINSLTK